MRLVNETFEDCKKHVVVCIDRLLARVTTIKKNELFNLSIVMFSDNKVSIQIPFRYIQNGYIILIFFSANSH